MDSDPVSGHVLVVVLDHITLKVSPRFTDDAHIKSYAPILILLQQSSRNILVMLPPLFSGIPLSHNISRLLNTIQLYLSTQSQIYPLLPTVTTMNIIGLLALFTCYPRTTPAYPPYHG